MSAAAPLEFLSLNSDKSVSQLVLTCNQEWKTTAQAPGVHRQMIERLGGEVARCTTIVRFDPNQAFPPHTHSGGEEFFVLDGVWSDGYGDFPKYSYIRNYIGSSHQPHVKEAGVRIMVKLRQMSEEEKEPEHRRWDAAYYCTLGGAVTEGWEQIEASSPKHDATDTYAPTRSVPACDRSHPYGSTGRGDASGGTHAKVGMHGSFSGDRVHSIALGSNLAAYRKVLYQSRFETVSGMVMRRKASLDDNIWHMRAPKGGMEIFVVDGSMTSREFGVHDTESWCRLVEDAEAHFTLGAEFLYLYVKEGHLRSPEIGISNIPSPK